MVLGTNYDGIYIGTPSEFFFDEKENHFIIVHQASSVAKFLNSNTINTHQITFLHNLVYYSVDAAELRREGGRRRVFNLILFPAL